MATLADSYSESNQNVVLSLINPDWALTKAGQSFTAIDGVIDSCKFYLKKSGSPTGNAVAKIYNITGTYGVDAKPTGAALATSNNFNVANLTTTLALATFNFSGANRITLVSGLYYVISVEYSNGDLSNYVQTGYDNSSPTHSGNYCSYDGSWWGGSGNDVCFHLYEEVSESGYSSPFPSFKQI
jgi:hypothetical protein